MAMYVSTYQVDSTTAVPSANNPVVSSNSAFDTVRVKNLGPDRVWINQVQQASPYPVGQGYPLDPNESVEVPADTAASGMQMNFSTRGSNSSATVVVLAAG